MVGLTWRSIARSTVNRDICGEMEVTNMFVDASQTGRVASVLVSCLFALSLAAACFMIARHGSQLRAGVDAQRAQEIDQESKTFCRKFGIGPETGRYSECASALLEIRKRHEERIASDSLGIC